MLSACGKTKTAHDWSKHPLCTVSYQTIIRRFRSGINHYDCIFLNPKKREDYEIPKDCLLLEIDGVTKNLRQWCLKYESNYVSAFHRYKRFFGKIEPIKIVTGGGNYVQR